MSYLTKRQSFDCDTNYYKYITFNEAINLLTNNINTLNFLKKEKCNHDLFEYNDEFVDSLCSDIKKELAKFDKSMNLKLICIGECLNMLEKEVLEESMDSSDLSFTLDRITRVRWSYDEYKKNKVILESDVISITDIEIPFIKIDYGNLLYKVL